MHGLLVQSKNYSMQEDVSAHERVASSEGLQGIPRLWLSGHNDDANRAKSWAHALKRIFSERMDPNCMNTCLSAETGADVSVVDEAEQGRLLEVLCEYGHYEMVVHLLAAGCRVPSATALSSVFEHVISMVDCSMTTEVRTGLCNFCGMQTLTLASYACWSCSCTPGLYHVKIVALRPT